MSGATRREFLQAAASTAAITAGCGGNKNRWRFLTDAEASTLAAVCDQIIPPDEHPGASQAGVAGYIDRQLAVRFRDLQGVYRAGLASLDRLSGGAFTALPLPKQLELITALEERKTGDAQLRGFFGLVVSHTMQGFYGSPRHGGNLEYVSWTMLGVPAPQVRGRRRYDVEPKA